MNPNELLARLRDLRNAAGEALHQRLTLAQQLLDDRGWVADPAGGGGDEFQAMDRLEEFFAECTSDRVTLAKLLLVHRKHPKKDWEKHKYNVFKMLESYDQANRPKPRTNAGAPASPPPNGRTHGGTAPPPPPARDDTEELRRENAELKRENRELHKRLDESQKENKKLRKSVQSVQKALDAIRGISTAEGAEE